MKKRVKKILSIFLAVVLVCGCTPLMNLADFGLVASAATEYTYGDFKFTLDNSNATITRYSGNATDTVQVPEKVSDGGFEYTVVGIAAKAFEKCGSNKVVIPERVTKLMGQIFYEAAVTEVTINGRITDTGVVNSFSYYGPFYGSKVTTVTMAQSNIPRCLFSGCSTLKTVNLPEKAKDANDIIGDHAFYECFSLESISIPEGIKEIHSQAFDGCALNNFSIPNTVESIGGAAFANCKNLESIVIPESVTKLMGQIFNGSAVTEVTINGRITETGVVESFSYYGPFYGSKVTTVTMAQSNIPRCLFSGCSTLKTVNLPEKAKNANDIIGDHAFYECFSLESISIPEGIKEIHSQAFAGCKKLNSIVIPASVTKIANQSFYGCSNLAYIHINSTNCEYSDLTDILSTVICKNPCEHTVNTDTPVTPPDEPSIPEEPEVIQKESSNGIKVEYDPSYFENNDNIVLKAEEENTENGNFAEYNEDGVVIKRYDIHLEDNDGNVIKSGENSTEYTVRIPVPAEYENYKQFLIRHWKTLENGNRKGENLTGIVENGYIVFKTSSFSYFDICIFGLEQQAIELNYKDTASVAATKDSTLSVIYTSSNPKVVTVDENGNLTTTGRGTATITATVETETGENITDTCEVTVKFTFWQWIIYILFLGFLWY